MKRSANDDDSMPLLADLKKRRTKKAERRSRAEPDDTSSPSLSGSNDDSAEEEPTELSTVSRQVTPLFGYSYPTQMKLKHQYIRTCMKQVTRQVFKGSPDTPDAAPHWCQPSVARNFHGIPVAPCVESPPAGRLEYRNKCEFTIGLRDPPANPRHHDESDHKMPRRLHWPGEAHGDSFEVGFVCGYQHGEPLVRGPSGSLHVPIAMVEVTRRLKEIINTSKLPVYSRQKREGVWRLAMVRSSRATKQLMVAIQVHASATPEMLMLIKKLLLEHLVGLGEVDLDAAVHIPKRSKARFIYDGYTIESLYLQHRAEVSEVFEGPVEKIWGSDGLQLELHGLSFHVTPLSFFQTNTVTAEILFTEIIRRLKPTDSVSTIIDVCCGTGTIALLCAPMAKDGQVFGIDSNESAIQDAQTNAARNGISNVHFRVGKAETVLPLLLKELRANPATAEHDIAVVVDPPRSGLHASVLDALRDNNAIGSLVYVSCNPDTLATDLTRLCTPTGAMKYGIFQPVEAVPVDMFPHTYHCEVIVELRRIPEPKVSDESAMAIKRANENPLLVGT